jgi:hypothetical protein
MMFLEVLIQVGSRVPGIRVTPMVAWFQCDLGGHGVCHPHRRQQSAARVRLKPSLLAFELGSLWNLRCLTELRTDP